MWFRVETKGCCAAKVSSNCSTSSLSGREALEMEKCGSQRKGTKKRTRMKFLATRDMCLGIIRGREDFGDPVPESEYRDRDFVLVAKNASI